MVITGMVFEGGSVAEPTSDAVSRTRRRSFTGTSLHENLNQHKRIMP
jgi:hypothetical protein